LLEVDQDIVEVRVVYVVAHELAHGREDAVRLAEQATHVVQLVLAHLEQHAAALLGVVAPRSARAGGSPGAADAARADGEGLAEVAPLDKLRDRLKHGQIAQHLADHELHAASVTCVDHGAAVSDAQRHGLLTEHVLPRLGGGQGHLAVSVVGRGDDDGVHVVAGEELVLLHEAAGIKLLGHGAGLLLHDVAHGDHVGVGKALGAAGEAGAHVATAQQTEANDCHWESPSRYCRLLRLRPAILLLPP